MNQDIKILLALLTTVLVLFATTLLLDLEWIKRFFIRQLLVYLLMVLEAFVAYRNIREINK